jgi:hypothetical protein
MNKRNLNLTGCILLIFVLYTPKAARSFVCEHVLDAYGNATGPSLGWSTPEITYHIINESQKLSTQAIQEAFVKAAQTWTRVAVRADDANCPDRATATGMVFKEGEPINQNFIGYNFLEPQKNRNIILVRDLDWSYSASLPAVVTLTYNHLTGEIFDADAELNTQYAEFSSDGRENTHDLEAVATYVLGRMMGFAFSDIPTASLSLEGSFVTANKRLLSCDDANAILFRYPAPTSDPNNPVTRYPVYCFPSVQSCGFCNAPSTLRFEPQLTTLRRNNGKGGCQSFAASPFLMLIYLVIFIRHRKT